MLSSQSDPKELSDWIELDYFDRPRALGRRRKYIVRGFWLGSLVLGIGLAAISFTNWNRAKAIYQAAPVSTPHAMFNDDCNRCHAESFGTWKRFYHQNDGLPSIKDNTCNECHRMADHQTNQTFTPAC